MWSAQNDIHSMIQAALKRNKDIRQATTYNSGRNISTNHGALYSFVPYITDPIAWTALVSPRLLDHRKLTTD